MKTEEVMKQTKDGMAMTEEYTGVCRFCGQMKTGTLPVGMEWTQEDIDEYVAETCDCAESAIYSRKKKQKEVAMRQIELLFGKDSDMEQEEDIMILLRGGAISMVEGKLQKLSIDINAQIKARMSMTSKGKIKIERQDTKKDACEA